VFSRILFYLVLFVSRRPKWVIFGLLVVLIVLPFAWIIGAKVYQYSDRSPDRGAIAIKDGAFRESFQLPEYLDQGWDAPASLWFYNTTQGSALLPYDFFLALEQPDKIDDKDKVECKKGGEKAAWFRCDINMDRFRYLPQTRTWFNPDALPVGFVKKTYQGKDYVGLTCAACHTGQVNFKGRALRIDGGPAMADMVGFLTDLTKAMEQTRRKADKENPQLQRFVKRVIALNNDYGNAAEVENDLNKWTDVRHLYDIVNRSTYNLTKVEYGYARLDAFGRIYNRVLQHAINRQQIAEVLRSVIDSKEGATHRLLSDAEVETVLRDVGEPDNIILSEAEFWKILANLQSDAPGFPKLNLRQMLLVRDGIFNPPNAPVSYPFLWDITHSDYVQWNGLANNATLGPLGRNTGEVIGVFAILDWHQARGLGAWFRKYSLPALLSGQSNKRTVVNFKSSVDLFNLQRLESQLLSLKSPQWPFCRNASTKEYYLPTGPKDEPVDQRPCNTGDKRIDEDMRDRGRLIYAKKCQGCHVVIDREAWDRIIVGKLLATDSKQSTDDAMASNSVNYKGKAGNFKDIYQDVGVGTVIVGEDAPAVQILTAATRGVVATPDADKWLPRRLVEWIYTLFMAVSDNPIKASMKAGDYNPDTTANPYNSLKAYRARSLNGIWATAPYLHNGSVPSLYDLLLPENQKSEKCPASRPKTFMVGAREFDPKKVGFRSEKYEGYDGFEFKTDIRGNKNKGHEYGACMSEQDRWDLIEYLKSL